MRCVVSLGITLNTECRYAECCGTDTEFKQIGCICLPNYKAYFKLIKYVLFKFYISITGHIHNTLFFITYG
jgi:hypothetical protein